MATKPKSSEATCNPKTGKVSFLGAEESPAQYKNDTARNKERIAKNNQVGKDAPELKSFSDMANDTLQSQNDSLDKAFKDCSTSKTPVQKFARGGGVELRGKSKGRIV